MMIRTTLEEIAEYGKKFGPRDPRALHPRVGLLAERLLDHTMDRGVLLTFSEYNKLVVSELRRIGHPAPAESVRKITRLIVLSL